jgi:hypothetical protein
MKNQPGSTFMKASLQATRPAALLLCLGLLALAPGRAAALGSRFIGITTSGYAGSAPLTNFPLLVRLSTAITGFNYTLCQTNGADLAFYDGHNLLAHEIDTWDTNGTSLVWVRVPELTTNTTIRLVFGNPADVAPAFTTNGTVWADGFRAVWHMDDGTSSNNILDSTANRFVGVKKAAGAPAETDAVVGKGQLFASNNINLTGLKDPSTTHTVSMWIKGSSLAANQFVFDVASGRFLIGWSTDTTAGKIGLYRTAWGIFGNTPSTNVWHHIAVCCGGTEARMYVDGVQYGPQVGYAGVGIDGQVMLGSRYAVSGSNWSYFAGLLDEVRVSSVLRSTDWIQAAYSNMVPGSTFTAYSPVDSLGTSLQIVGHPSDYGVADPVYGLHEGLENGHTYTCSVSRVWNDVTEGIRFLCTGWKRYGIDRDTYEELLLDEAATNELVYTHTDIERLEWNFARQYMIAFTAAAGGTVSTTGGWHTADSRVTVTATPSDGYAFVCWEGDVPQSVVDPYAARISFLADQPRGLTAVFKPAVTFYVSTTGLDTNNGSELLPFATLTNAVAQVTAVYDAANAYTIIIEDGEYTHGNIKINVPLTIKSRNGLGSVTLVNSIVIGAGTGTSSANVAFYLNADGIVLDGLLFRPQMYPTGNTSSGPGRAITAVKRAIIRNCAVRNWQTAGYSVDGIVALAGGSVFENGEMINCIVRSSGGQPRYGIIYVNGNASVIDTVITNCSLAAQTSSSGSAIYAAGTAVGSLLVRNSLIAKCTSNRSGNTDTTLGGAIYLSGANMKAVLENVTLADCKDIGRGIAGLNVRSVASLSARNVLFYDNRNSSTVKDVGFAAGMAAKSQFDNCAFTESLPVGVSGTGNVAVYEPFVGGDDYHLVSSPAVEAGANLDWALDAEARDLGGAPRLDASRVDIGCYEKELAAIECFIVEAYHTGAFEPATFTYSAHVIGTNAYGLTYTWTLSGSAADTLSGAAALSYATTLPGGEYVLSLCVTNGDGTVVSAPTPRTISVFSDSIYVSLRGSEEVPYNTAAKGFRTLGAAIAYAADGQKILLTSGTHLATNALTVAKALTIRSETGDPGDVIFAPPADSSYIYTSGSWMQINNASAVVRDLTFSNIWVRAPGGYANTAY